MQTQGSQEGLAPLENPQRDVGHELCRRERLSEAPLVPLTVQMLRSVLTSFLATVRAQDKQ